MKRVIGATLAVAACSAGFAVGAQAGGDKVWLCHGTSSEKNPYVLIHVSENALGGHLDGTGPGHGHGTNPNHNVDYVLPAGQSDCSGVPGGEGGEGGGE